MISSLNRLWAYRGFIGASVAREFTSRYRNSILGAAWVVLNPLVLMLIYTLVFAKVMQVRLPNADSTFAYSIFLVSGMIPWTLFAELVGRSPNVFLDQANLLKKIQFPKLALVLVISINSLINFSIIFLIFCIFLIAFNEFPGHYILGILPLLVLQTWIMVSLSIVLAVLNIFFRDVLPLTNICLQFGFWLTPVVYAPSMIPAAYRSYLNLNPLSAIFDGYHQIFVYHQWPDWTGLVPAIILGFLLTFLARHLYLTHGAEMVDEL